MNKRYSFILVLILVALSAKGQQRKDTVLKGSTIEVLQSYKPEVKEAPKPEWIPQLPPADTTHPLFNYDVPQQTLYYTYSSLPLRPIALGKIVPELPFQNYVKIGGGNLSTVYFDAGIGGIKGANYETDFHLHYLSQMGNIKYQQSSLGGLEAEWLQHGHKSDWHTVLNAENNSYDLYGYRHDLYPNFSSDTMKQSYTTIRLAVDVKNRDSKAKFSYDPGVDASLYSASYGTSEMNIGLNLPFEYKIDNSIQALLTISGDDAHFSGDTSRDNTVAAVAPGLRVTTGVFSGHAIVGYAFGINNDQYVLPDIQAAVTIPHSRFTISAGYQSSLRQNTYQQLSTENPYLFNSFNMRQTQSGELFGQLQAGIGDHLVLTGRISSWNFTGLPEFLNDTLDHRRFYVVYDTVQAIAFRFTARYKVSDKWSAGFTGDFYNFSNGKQQHVWGEPDTKMKGDITATIAKKLVVSAYLCIMSGIYAKDANHNAVLMDPISDIGGSVEYQIVKRLSAFVQISNLLNNNYERWYGYQSYGFNIYGGLRLKF